MIWGVFVGESLWDWHLPGSVGWGCAAQGMTRDGRVPWPEHFSRREARTGVVTAVC